MYEYRIARTKYIDAAFRQALADDFGQIVLPGAGFDTRALRIRAASGRTQVFELFEDANGLIAGHINATHGLVTAALP